MSYFPKFDRHLSILLFTQAVAGSTVPVLFLVSGLMGSTLAPNLNISTLPMALLIVGIAVASPFASFVMSKTGRKRGHLLGLLLTITGVAIAGLALWRGSFWGYSLGNLVCGTGCAFNNQIRFTAAEVAGNDKALVHSWVLMFSLFAAFFGPWMTEHGHTMLDAGEYTGSISMLLVVLTVNFAVMTALPNRVVPVGQVQTEKRSPKKLLVQSKFWLAALCGITSYATMTLLMCATPLQMHEVEHFSHSDTTRTIQAHIVAMFLPSLFSGLLLSWLGIRKLIAMGILLFLICIGVTFFNSEFSHYWLALVLLGVGWNFLFLAGSTWISLSFDGPERFLAQGTNDALVFGIQSIASLTAGWLLFSFGWKTLVLLPVPLLVGLMVFAFKKAPAK